MSKTLLAVAMSIGLAAGAHAQAAFGDVTMSTDAAKAAAVERHAAELKASQADRMSAHTMMHRTTHAATKHLKKDKPAIKS